MKAQPVLGGVTVKQALHNARAEEENAAALAAFPDEARRAIERRMRIRSARRQRAARRRTPRPWER